MQDGFDLISGLGVVAGCFTLLQINESLITLMGKVNRKINENTTSVAVICIE